MPGVDENAIRAAIDAGVRAALAALHETDDEIQVADEFPDWNEYVDDNGVLAEPAYEAALAGQWDKDLVGPLADPAPPAVSPIPRHIAPERGVPSGHTLSGSQMASLYEREVLAQRRAIPVEQQIV